MTQFLPNVQLSFNNSWGKKIVPSEQQFITDMISEMGGIAKAFYISYEITRNNWNQLDFNARTPNRFAVEMQGNLLSEIAQKTKLVFKTKKNLRYFIDSGNKYEIHIKKLTSKSLSPKYHHTNTSLKRLNQVKTNQNDVRTIIYIGYTLDRRKNLTGLYIVCRNIDDVFWKIDLSQFAQHNTGIGNNSLNIPQTSKPLVKPKNNKGRGSKTA